MASPKGLRLFLGSRLPDEVLDLMFSFGVHLWLAAPYDAFYQVLYENGRRGYTCYRQYRMWTNIPVVSPYDLSESTRALVKYDEYRRSRTGGRLTIARRARPIVCLYEKDQFNREFQALLMERGGLHDTDDWHWAPMPDGWAFGHFYHFRNPDAMALDIESGTWVQSRDVHWDIDGGRSFIGFLEWEIPPPDLRAIVRNGGYADRWGYPYDYR